MFRNSISDDSYSYVLELRTQEGFSFKNNLKYLVNEIQHGFSLYYSYDLATNSHTLEIERAQERPENPVIQKLKEFFGKIRELFTRIFSRMDFSKCKAAA